MEDEGFLHKYTQAIYKIGTNMHEICRNAQNARPDTRLAQLLLTRLRHINASTQRKQSAQTKCTNPTHGQKRDWLQYGAQNGATEPCSHACT